MVTHDQDLGARLTQNLRDEQPEFSVAQYHTFLVGHDVNLFEHLVGGGERLREDRHVVGDALRNGVEIRNRDVDVLRETSVGIDDPHDATGGAVALEPLVADGATLARKVDFSDDPLAAPLLGPLFDDADELVAECSAKRHVTLDEFDIGVADAGDGDAHER